MRKEFGFIIGANNKTIGYVESKDIASDIVKILKKAGLLEPYYYPYQQIIFESKEDFLSYLADDSKEREGEK